MTNASEYPAGPARTDDEIIDAIVGLYKGFPEGSMIFHEAVNMLYQLPEGPLPELDVPLRALEARAAECKGYATLAVAEIMTLINSRPRSPQEDELVVIIERAVQRRLDGLAVKCAERDAPVALQQHHPKQ